MPGEDLLLEPLECGAWLEAELFGQQQSSVLVGLERLRLSACLVEGEHQLSARPLPKRVLGDKPFELADEVGVPSEREVGLDPLLEGA